MQNRPLAALTSKSGLGALFLFACAAVTYLEVAKLHLGTPSAMGPGYFPAILGGFFIVFGLILLVEGWRKPQERVEVGQIAPVLYLLGAIVLFGLLYPIAGGVVAIAVLIVVAAIAEPGRTWRELAALTGVVLVAVWVVFVIALDLQLDALPRWLR
ncbi:tripartite tricarboxylate transporter TctB family protein [Salipiger sp. IMCC34102]|uniref:tripartite tricarboxylate transporter TctB family protein n=1 Tax=Salipiger sp. IMCC34102 TaxID=2510647 RepID=UPI0013EAFA71|nr:tripartite tricarboxylate transporter TctB family protein [Salipiger sp. IMCC34102]